VLKTFTDRIMTEPENAVRRRVVNACMHVARVADSWPGVVEGAISGLTSGSPALKEALLTLLARIVEAKPDWVNPYAGSIAAPAAACLGKEHPSTLRSAAALCICQVATRLDKPEHVAAYSPALPLLLDVARDLESAHETEDAQEVLSAVDGVLTGRDSRDVIKPSAVEVARRAEAIASTDGFDETLRATALHLLVHVCLAAGPQVRAARIHETLITLLLRLMSRVPEEGAMLPATFVASPFHPERLAMQLKELAHLATAAEEALAVVSGCFGGALIFPVATKAVFSLVSPSMAWNVRRAGIYALGVVIATCGRPTVANTAGHGKKSITGGLNLDQRAAVLRLLCNSLETDADPRVRYESAHALSKMAGSLCEADSPIAKIACKEFCTKAGALTTLAKAIHPSSGNAPCVVGMCASAVASVLSVACRPESLAPRLDELMAALTPVLSTGNPSVTAQILRTISSASGVAGEAFGKFYASLMPPIKALAASHSVIGDGEEAAEVRAASMVCLGSLVEAVSPEMFRADAGSVLMPILEAAKAGAMAGSAAAAPGTKTDGRALRLGEAALTAIGRIASHMGSQVAPFMELLVPTLLAAAAVDVGYNVTEVDDEDLSGRTARQAEAAKRSLKENSGGTTVGSVVLEMRGVGSVRVEINTDAVTEKIQALSALLSLTRDCGTAIGPFAQVIVAAMLKEVSFKLNAGCRSLAADCIFPAISAFIDWKMESEGATAEAAMAQAAPMLATALAAVAEQASKEVTTDGAPLSMTESLRALACLTLAGTSVNSHLFSKADRPLLPMPEEAASKVVFAAAAAAGMAAARIQAKAEDIASQGDTDAQALQEMREDLEDEETILSQSIDALGYTIKNARAAVLPAFEANVVPLFGPALVEAVPPVIRHAALCAFVDVCEWCGEGASRYAPQTMAAVGQGLIGSDEDVRQVCCYGVGAMAQSQPAVLKPFSKAAVSALTTIIARPESRSEENEFATDNAISALSKVLVSCGPPEGVDAGALWKGWVSALPIRSDETEAYYCHSLLVQEVEKNNPLIMGKDATNLPQVLRVFGEVLSSSAGGGGAGVAMAEDDDEELEDDITLASDATLSRIRAVVKGMAAVVPPSALASAVMSLPDHAKIALATAFAS
jgi:importin-5